MCHTLALAPCFVYDMDRPKSRPGSRSGSPAASAGGLSCGGGGTSPSSLSPAPARAPSASALLELLRRVLLSAVGPELEPRSDGLAVSELRDAEEPPALQPSEGQLIRPLPPATEEPPEHCGLLLEGGSSEHAPPEHSSKGTVTRSLLVSIVRRTQEEDSARERGIEVEGEAEGEAAGAFLTPSHSFDDPCRCWARIDCRRVSSTVLFRRSASRSSCIA